jgi:sulfur-carrier protein adenylyltransferase/sulfurtransferase
MKEITALELQKFREKNIPHQLIDIREIHELEICSIQGDHIPMGEIVDRSDEIRTDIPVIFHCRSGARAAAVIMTLQKKFKFKNLYNLCGGILAWAEEVDHSLEQY